MILPDERRIKTDARDIDGMVRCKTLLGINRTVALAALHDQQSCLVSFV